MNYLNEDNQRIEPTWYMPIIPMVLVNGAEGIGTGWSSKVPNYDPREIIAVSNFLVIFLLVNFAQFRILC